MTADPWRCIRRCYPVAPTPDYPRNAMTLAFHEAGHALLCAIFRVPMTGAEIDRTGVYAGKVSFEAQPDNDASVPADALRRSALRLAAMFQSGVVAEIIHHGLEIPEGHVLLRETSDWDKARRVLELGGVVGSATGGLYVSQQLAFGLLHSGWAGVESLAHVLLRRGTVKQYEILQIFHGELGALSNVRPNAEGLAPSATIAAAIADTIIRH